MIPSIDDAMIPLLTIINGALIQDIGKKDILTFYTLISLYETVLVISGENFPEFRTMFLSAF